MKGSSPERHQRNEFRNSPRRHANYSPYIEVMNEFAAKNPNYYKTQYGDKGKAFAKIRHSIMTPSGTNDEAEKTQEGFKIDEKSKSSNANV